MYRCENWTIKKAEHQRIDAFKLWCWRRLLRVRGPQGDQTSPPWRKSALNIHWKDWCWSWKSSTFITWCEELTHWKRPWCWERLKTGGEGDDRGWDGWMASPTRWTWVWVNSGSWWWTGRPGVLQSMGSQRVGHNWATELNRWDSGESFGNKTMRSGTNHSNNTRIHSVHLPIQLLSGCWYNILLLKISFLHTDKTMLALS